MTLFTARDEVGARLCFYTCVILFRGGGLSLSACWDTPRQVDPPPARQKPPGKETPPCAVYAGRYGQQAGGMHPTGIQFFLLLPTSREGNIFTGLSFCPQSTSCLLVHCSSLLRRGRQVSYCKLEYFLVYYVVHNTKL